MAFTVFIALAIVWIVSSIYFDSRRSKAIRDLKALSEKAKSLDHRMSEQLRKIQSIDLDPSAGKSNLDSFFLGPYTLKIRLGSWHQEENNNSPRVFISARGGHEDLTITRYEYPIPPSISMKPSSRKPVLIMHSRSDSYFLSGTWKAVSNFVDDEEELYGIRNTAIHQDPTVSNSWLNLIDILTNKPHLKKPKLAGIKIPCEPLGY